MAEWGKWGGRKTAGMFSAAKICCRFCPSVSNQGRKFVEVCYIFKSSLLIHWSVPYRRPNLPSNLWNGALLLSHYSAAFSYVFLWAPFGRTTWILSVFNWIIPAFELRKPLKCLFSPWRCHWNLFGASIAFTEKYFEAIFNTDMFRHLKFVNCT